MRGLTTNTDPIPASSTLVPSDKPDKKDVRSTLVSRNVTIAGHRTSVRLEPEMWSGLIEICRREHAKMHAVCTMVSRQKPENTSLTAAIRVFIMAYYRVAATEDGHVRAGHGYGLSAIAGRVNMAQPLMATSSAPVSSSSTPAPVAVQKPIMQNRPFMLGMSRYNSSSRTS